MELFYKQLRYRCQMLRHCIYRQLHRKKAYPKPLLVFGNQKSGTSAIAALLGIATGKSVLIDLFHRFGARATPVLYGTTSLQQIWGQASPYLDREIIKEPEFIFFSDELRAIYADSLRLFITREPLSNFRSIYNRLGVDGYSTHLDKRKRHEIQKTCPLWLPVVEGPRPELRGGTILETLALRWKYAANLYLESQDQFTLVRYEDFVADRKGTIEHIATRLNLPIKNDITKASTVQFQPPGKPTNTLRFFGDKHAKAAFEICQPEADTLGYCQPT
ncbi:sulfotransferase [Crateriforma conspicua]|uniref:Sulfotransferase domain protein n=1 Tax=Crateriforma conspicua TaxID=2527996 RepID=A0A5C6FX61_9PLAN|nr:sulfotransferase [Crateriforma conspicua]TWU67587.1 hypothetical protein V7x_31620 [Crateriforma conspicua]